MLRRGYLTDRQIERYRKAGWYSAEFRTARKEKMAAKRARSGNFVSDGGRLIYSPL